LEASGHTADVKIVELDTFTRNSGTSYVRPDDESDIFPGNRSDIGEEVEKICDLIY
jgi:hypothetical protein